MSITPGGLVIPDQEIALIQARLAATWNYTDAAHHVIIAENGSGKTYLITRAILPLCAFDRVLIIDVKGDDPVWTEYGTPIDRVTPGMWGTGGGPCRNWYRLVVDPIGDKAGAKRVVAEALDIVLDEGHYILVIDETRAITDKDELNEGARLEAVLLRGRSRAAQVIMAAQATEYMIPSTRNQWAFAWVGSVKDDDVIKRALKILSMPHTGPGSLLRTIGANPKRRWLYVDQEDAGAMAWTRAA